MTWQIVSSCADSHGREANGIPQSNLTLTDEHFDGVRSEPDQSNLVRGAADNSVPADLFADANWAGAGLILVTGATRNLNTKITVPVHLKLTDGVITGNGHLLITGDGSITWKESDEPLFINTGVISKTSPSGSGLTTRIYRVVPSSTPDSRVQVSGGIPHMISRRVWKNSEVPDATLEPTAYSLVPTAKACASLAHGWHGRGNRLHQRVHVA